MTISNPYPRHPPADRSIDRFLEITAHFLQLIAQFCQAFFYGISNVLKWCLARVVCGLVW